MFVCVMQKSRESIMLRENVDESKWDGDVRSQKRLAALVEHHQTRFSRCG